MVNMCLQALTGILMLCIWAYGPPVKQALRIHGKHYVLADYFASGTMIDIEMKKFSPLKIILDYSEGGCM